MNLASEALDTVKCKSVLHCILGRPVIYYSIQRETHLQLEHPPVPLRAWSSCRHDVVKTGPVEGMMLYDVVMLSFGNPQAPRCVHLVG